MSNHHNIDDFGDRIGDIANPIVIEVEDMPVTFNFEKSGIWKK